MYCNSVYETDGVLYARNSILCDELFKEAKFLLNSKNVLLAPIEKVGYYLDLKYISSAYKYTQNGLTAEFKESISPDSRTMKITNSQNEILLKTEIKKTISSRFKINEV